MRGRLHYVWLFLTLGCAAGADRPTGLPERPNVLLILADDLGTECLATYGGNSHATPVLDGLAAEGLVFENAFATPVCTPTRVELLTGLYPFRTGWTVGEWVKKKGERTVDPALPSIGRVLRDAGYRTAVAGKWQLSRPYEVPDHPERMGFEQHLLWTYHRADEPRSPDARFWAPWIVEDGVVREDLHRDDVYGPDVFVGYLVEFMREALAEGEPFFAFYSAALVHRPYLATPHTVGDAGAAVAETPAKRDEDLARFGENVTYLDALVGELVGCLEELGARDDTLLLFTSDNGTDARLTSYVGNLPVPGGKTHMDDVGAGVPLIASWPGVLPAGARTTALVDFTDLLPTLAEVCGARPSSRALDGVSFAPLLAGERLPPAERRRWVFVELGERWFLRTETYRLHQDGRFYDVRERYRPIELTPERETPHARATREALAREAAALFASG